MRFCRSASLSLSDLLFEYPALAGWGGRPKTTPSTVVRTFREIAAALPNTGGRRAAILDGEIVAPDAEGVPSFSRLQRRWPQCRRPGTELLREVPVRLFVFDIVTCDGENVASRSYVDRRDALTARIGKSGTVQVPPSWADVDPAVILGAAEELRLEGDCVQAAGHRTG